MGGSLARKLVKPVIGLCVLGIIIGGSFKIHREGVYNSRINQLFNQKIESRYGVCRSYSTRIALACFDANIPYNPQNPRELTTKEKVKYLEKVCNIEIDKKRNVIR